MIPAESFGRIYRTDITLYFGWGMLLKLIPKLIHHLANQPAMR